MKWSRISAAPFHLGEDAMNISFTDNSDAFRDALKRAELKALETVGLVAEGYAKKLCPVDTGNLRNSITHRVELDGGNSAAYVGTNSEYAAYVELGTGQYVSGGRPTPWVYKDAKGNWHYTRGNKAQPFIKPAVSDHAQEYRDIISDTLKDA